MKLLFWILFFFFFFCRPSIFLGVKYFCWEINFYLTNQSFFFFFLSLSFIFISSPDKISKLSRKSINKKFWYNYRIMHLHFIFRCLIALFIHVPHVFSFYAFLCHRIWLWAVRRWSRNQEIKNTPKKRITIHEVTKYFGICRLIVTKATKSSQWKFITLHKFSLCTRKSF